MDRGCAGLFMCSKMKHDTVNIITHVIIIAYSFHIQSCFMSYPDICLSESWPHYQSSHEDHQLLGPEFQYELNKWKYLILITTLGHGSNFQNNELIKGVVPITYPLRSWVGC
jgi:hypothetical protein